MRYINILLKTQITEEKAQELIKKGINVDMFVNQLINQENPALPIEIEKVYLSEG